MCSKYFSPLGLLVFTSLFMGLFAGCKEKNRKEKHPLANTIYSEKNYSEVILDSLAVDSILLNNKVDTIFQTNIRDFYSRRKYQTAWFNNKKLTENTVNFIYRIDEFKVAYNDSSIISKKNYNLLTRALLDSAFEFQNKSIITELDINLTITFFKYASKEYYGVDTTEFDLEWFIPRKKKNYGLLLEKITASKADFEKYEPVNRYYTSLKQVLLQYRKIDKNGGFPFISKSEKFNTIDDSLMFYKVLSDYLKLTNDWPLETDSLAVNDCFTLAIKNFQQRFGLTSTGMLDDGTIKEMNVPIEERIFQMMVNLERLRWLPEKIPENYILVNIPAYSLYVFEKNLYNFSMKVVVGKSVTSTTIFSGNLSSIVFSPHWNVPQSIIINDLLPKLKKVPNYLSKKNMIVLKNNQIINAAKINWNKYNKSVPYVIRENPGRQNSLGLIKFLFPNNYDIYMHDTPSKNLFEKDNRAFSHGCIRLEEPLKLASYLLKNDKRMSEQLIVKWMHGGVEKYVAVKPTVPVFIVYFTSWVNHKGQVNFRKDIYGLDKKLSTEIFD